MSEETKQTKKQNWLLHRSPAHPTHTVDSVLRGRHSVDGGHQTLRDAKVVVNDLGQRRQAVGCARRYTRNPHTHARARKEKADRKILVKSKVQQIKNDIT